MLRLPSLPYNKPYIEKTTMETYVCPPWFHPITCMTDSSVYVPESLANNPEHVTEQVQKNISWWPFAFAGLMMTWAYLEKTTEIRLKKNPIDDKKIKEVEEDIKRELKKLKFNNPDWTDADAVAYLINRASRYTDEWSVLEKLKNKIKKNPSQILRKCPNCKKNLEIDDLEFMSASSDVMGGKKSIYANCKNCKSTLLIKRDLLKGGMADYVPDDAFETADLEYGIKHEMEHTNDRLLAKEIAKDHLIEDPDYYRKLDKAMRK